MCCCFIFRTIPFLQVLTDGSTLASRGKYQALSLAYAKPTSFSHASGDWTEACKHTVTLGFPHNPDGTGETVARMVIDYLVRVLTAAGRADNENTREFAGGLIVGSCQDYAALTVAAHLGVDKEGESSACLLAKYRTVLEGGRCGTFSRYIVTVVSIICDLLALPFFPCLLGWQGVSCTTKIRFPGTPLASWFVRETGSRWTISRQ